MNDPDVISDETERRSDDDRDGRVWHGFFRLLLAGWAFLVLRGIISRIVSPWEVWPVDGQEVSRIFWTPRAIGGGAVFALLASVGLLPSDFFYDREWKRGGLAFVIAAFFGRSRDYAERCCRSWWWLRQL